MGFPTWGYLPMLVASRDRQRKQYLSEDKKIAEFINSDPILKSAHDLLKDTVLKSKINHSHMKKATKGPGRPKKVATPATPVKAKVKNYKAATRNTRNPEAIKFLYQNAKNEAGIRTIVPSLTLLRRNGKLFITGHDIDQNAPRTFELAKIKSFV